MVDRASPWGLALPIVWLLMGCVAALPWLGLAQGIAAWPLILPAIPLWAIDSRLGTRRVTEGLLWVTGHSPPCLNPAGLLVVYFVPALTAILWRLHRILGGRGQRPVRRTGLGDGEEA